MEDKDIIQLYFDRNEQAISETDSKYGKLCRKMATNILYNEQDSEECVNSSYLKLWNAIPPQNPDSLCAYLCAIIRNTAMTVLKKRSAYGKSEQMTELMEIIPDRQDIEKEYDEKQTARLINEYLKTAPRKSRDVFVLRYYCNMSIAEVAGSLKMNEITVRTRLSRIRQSLRKFLKENGYDI